ncbi:MAG: hypothetical protein DMG61_17295 [Acidobacteria bacterium]|nr:MAG: hypothetical protein DMG61_17295 [Acidobacteriota bacterium]
MSGFRAQNVGIGDRQVVTGNREVEIVLQSEGNRVGHGEIDLAVANQLVHTRRVRKIRCGDLPRLVRSYRPLEKAVSVEIIQSAKGFSTAGLRSSGRLGNRRVGSFLREERTSQQQTTCERDASGHPTNALPISCETQHTHVRSPIALEVNEIETAATGESSPPQNICSRSNLKYDPLNR